MSVKSAADDHDTACIFFLRKRVNVRTRKAFYVSGEVQNVEKERQKSKPLTMFRTRADINCFSGHIINLR